MKNISIDRIWESLLILKNKVLQDPNAEKDYSLIFGNQSCRVGSGTETLQYGEKSLLITRRPILSHSSDTFVFTFDSQNHITISGECYLDNTQVDFLNQYLPFCFLKVISEKLGRTSSVLHLAQSVDGKIATVSGQSKWVGNQENLIHAHRMRALCDAILVGNNTLKLDSPKLTVRHVPGTNPVRVFISNSLCKPDNTRKDESRILLFTSQNTGTIENIEIIRCPESSGLISPDFVLKELYKRKIFSLFIEGGAITASHFLKENAVDRVQLFISPQIFGSGINSFTLPPIENVNNSVGFVNSSFKPMGDGILFEGDVLKE